MAKIRKSKIAKYAGLAVAAVVVCGALSATISCLSVEDLSKAEMKEVTLEQTVVTSLEVELGGMEFILERGDSLAASTNDEDLKFIQKNGLLKIEFNDSLFERKINGKLCLTLPETVFESVEIDTGAGRVEIESLAAKTLDFQLGAGEVTIENLVVAQRAEIETGAGKFTVLDGEINNLDLDHGVGETSLKCKLTGANELDCGVGKLALELGVESDYKITVNKGIGKITVGGVERENGAIIGQGENVVDINGGVGDITVTFSA